MHKSLVSTMDSLSAQHPVADRLEDLYMMMLMLEKKLEQKKLNGRKDFLTMKKTQTFKAVENLLAENTPSRMTGIDLVIAIKSCLSSTCNAYLVYESECPTN